MLSMLFISLSSNAQFFNDVGTSESCTDSFGNTVTTHKDKYGNTTGYSNSSVDYWGMKILRLKMRMEILSALLQQVLIILVIRQQLTKINMVTRWELL